MAEGQVGKVDVMAKRKRKEKGKVCYVDGMPLNTVKALMESPKTPAKLKVAWSRKLDKLGVKL